MKNNTLIRSRGLVIHDDKILLMHRIKNGAEYYTLCGGKAEENETPETACVREIFEETALRVNVIKELYRYSDTHEGIKNIHIFFLCSCEGGTPKLNGEEIERNHADNYYNPLWIDLKSAPSLPIKPESILPVIAKLASQG